MTFDVKLYAAKVLKMTAQHAPQSTFPVPAGRLQTLCRHILDEEQQPAERPPLTDVEQSVLSAVKADIATGVKPTIRSVATRLQYKQHSSAQVAINNLIKHGYLKREGSRKQLVVVTLRK